MEANIKDYVKDITEKRKEGYIIKLYHILKSQEYIIELELRITHEFSINSRKREKQDLDQQVLNQFQGQYLSKIKKQQKRLTDQLAMEKMHKQYRNKNLENRICLFQSELLQEIDSNLSSEMMMDLIEEELEQEEEQQREFIKAEDMQY